MTASDAPTYGARSIYVAAFGLRLANHQTRAQHSIFHTLLITSKSDCEIPGPPLRGILSPPYKRGCIPSAPSASGVALSSVWLYTYRDVDDIDDIVRELTRVVGSEVVAAALDEEHLALVLCLERLERAHVRADVLADRGVRAPARLDREDARRGECLVFN